MFQNLKRKVKFASPPPVRIPIEEQLANLAEVGIALNPNIEISDLLEKAVLIEKTHFHPLNRLLSIFIPAAST
ncbi:hypothetical protein [Cohnella sp. GCM10012308]|uniref:hypothetical protein n=1 Tax=Cohnella sp. GCM10012308 TaxID=3317329 RepID=UPI00360B88CF